MDPNANLQEQLRLAAHLVWAVENERWIESDETDAAKLAELVIALHEWILKQGFLPEAWQLVQDKQIDAYVRDTLKERFPWLGTDDEAFGAETVDALRALWDEFQPMSAYASTTTKIRNPACLAAALATLGFPAAVLEVHDQPQSLVGYHGDVRQQKAEIIIRRRHIGSASNDIGFALQPDGTYAAIISQYDSHRFNTAWLNSLNQAYAEQTQVFEAEILGLVLREREVIDGEVTLSFALRE